MAEVLHPPLQNVKKKQQFAVLLRRLALCTLLLQLMSHALGAAALTPCGNEHFACKGGSCILLEKMCDGRQDCTDNSDEIDCDAKLCRKPNWFQCSKQDGACLSSDLVCNGIENCPGGEDEVDCAGSRSRVGADGTSSSSSSTDLGIGGWHSATCNEYEYTCDDKACIPLDFMCNGKVDCRDGSDESIGCTKAQASCKGFFCENRKCLESHKWMCDGTDDCGDGSDEKDCAYDCLPELNRFLCRNNKTCLDLAKACDGTPDCPDGSDESFRCTSPKDNCTNINCPPMSTCHMFPLTGPECICPKGYRHSKVLVACVDINECVEQYDICSQRCQNLPGSYRCFCDNNYSLSSNNKTCVAAQGEEALLLYSTQVTVGGIHLKSRRVFTAARNLTKVIGLAYDGQNIYWTNIQNEAESIVKAKVDGTEREILLTSGLDAPEDLAVDWLTGNIYFSDNVMRHIAVCSQDGISCTVLVTIDVHQPRGVALWPERAQIFWTDWGVKPSISRASMDGSNSIPLITDDIHWPNGIALDMHNDRIYWVDAKLSSIGSVRSDGTDRRTVLDEILKHPYGIAVFEDNLYWSDWGTKSIHSCNKFTGKDHKVLAKDRTIYAVHVYHSAKQPKIEHACMNTRCSHLCLLAERNTSTCACPDGMQLSIDHRRCVKTHKKQRLFLGVNNHLLEIEHTTFGRHIISQFHQLPMFVSEMVYNSVNGTIILADNIQRLIFEYDGTNNKITTLVRGNLGNVTGMAFDHLGHNLYWTDSERHVIEVLSLRTRERAIISFFSGLETPIGIAVVPDDGIAFVALRLRKQIHIDQLPLSGIGEHRHVFEDELGSNTLKFTVDYATQTIYWSDSNLGRISFSDYRNLQAYTFRGRLKRPYSIAIVDDDLFWSEMKSNTIYWTHKSNLGPLKRIEIEAPKDLYNINLPQRIPLIGTTLPMIVDHPCQHANGGCSHVCVPQGKFAGICLCPAGLVFKDASNHTCIDALDCEFRCRSGECLTQSRRCNGRKDCPDGSDEERCDPDSLKRKKVVCTFDEFMCHDNEQCIKNKQRCDGQKHCRDGSDEQHCLGYDKTKECHRQQHACDNGNCVDFSVMCDGVDDCGDNSDETNCKSVEGKDVADDHVVATCDKNMFQCNTGTCIAKSWECDGKLDCTDGSDEHDKCALKECPTSMHKCMLGQCIDARLICDGHNDCGDNSDETNCDMINGEKLKIVCGDDDAPMYQCKSNQSICLELTARCNGTAECPRGEDEADCGAICSIYEFQCKSTKECIRMEFRCDHDKDCKDGSDEQNCDNISMNGTALATNSRERACEANMYDCRDGQCVDLTRVCDGFPDCETGADEGPLCKTACKSQSAKRAGTCPHKCRATPSGAVCSCFHGYKLDADKRSCIDINECEDLDPCAQVCENNYGSYRCSCFPDFMLRPDKTTCKSIESNSSLMFSTYNEVRSMTEQPIILRVAWATPDAKILGFDVNVRKRLAYFTTESENILYQVDMETGEINAGLTLEMPTKVAVDWITDNVYVVSREQRYTVKVCSFAAKMCGRILQFGAKDIVKTITLDAYNRHLFLVIIRSQSFSPPFSEIVISSMDGDKKETLLTKNGGYITATACDPHKMLYYFVDSHTKTLQSISYKLGSAHTPTTIIRKGNFITIPSGITVYENKVFIVNIGSKEAVRCDLFGARSCKAFNLSILNAQDIVVDGASRQPMSKNPCTMAKCSGMCIQSEFSYECMCGNAIVSEDVHCPKVASNEITTSALLSKPTDGEEHFDGSSSPHVGAIVSLILLLLALIGVGIGYMYYRRVKQGHRDFNINLHFQNPLSSFGKSASHLFGSGGGGGHHNSNAKNGNAAASFETEREKLQFGMPIQRFLRGETSGMAGSEIKLETAKGTTLRGMEPARCLPCIMVEVDSDSDATNRTDGHYNDDARARLVS